MLGSHHVVTVVYVDRNIFFTAEDGLAELKFSMVKMFLSPKEGNDSRCL